MSSLKVLKSQSLKVLNRQKMTICKNRQDYIYITMFSSFAKKAPQCERLDSLPITVHNPHTIPISERNWTNVIRIISIDIGRKNFCFRCEYRTFDVSRQQPPQVVTEVLEKINFSTFMTDENGECKLYHMVKRYLDQYHTYYLQTNIFVVERQLAINYVATRIMQRSLDYFIDRVADLPLLPMIVEMDPKLPKRILKFPPGLNEKAIKQWAVERAMEILVFRGDKIAIQVIEKSKGKKKDDYSDTIIQAEAVCHILGIPTTFSHMPVTMQMIINVPMMPISNMTSGSLYPDNKFISNFNNQSQDISIEFINSTSTSTSTYVLMNDNIMITID